MTAFVTTCIPRPGQHAILMFAIFYHVIRTLRIKSLRTLRHWLHLFNPKELFFVVYRPERNNDEWIDVYFCNNMTIHLCTAMLFLCWQSGIGITRPFLDLELLFQLKRLQTFIIRVFGPNCNLLGEKETIQNCLHKATMLNWGNKTLIK